MGAVAQKKAEVYVGYLRGKSLTDHYQDKTFKRLAGADVTCTDGLGNVIQVAVRDDEHGYRISLNGKEIAIGGKMV